MTLEFGTSKIICAIGRKRPRGRFEVVSFSPVSYQGIKKGYWVSLENVLAALKKAISEAEAGARRKADEIYIGIPACFTRVHCTTSSRLLGEGSNTVTQAVINEMMLEAGDFEVPEDYELIAQMPVYFKLDEDNLFIDPLGIDASKIEGRFSYMFANKEFLHEVDTMMTLLGYDVTAFRPEVLCQALFLIPIEYRDSSSVLLDIGYNDTSVNVAYGDAIIYSRVIPVGGAQIASDLAKVLDIDPNAAERVKRRFVLNGITPSKNAKEIVRKKDGTLIELEKGLIKEVIEARIEHLSSLINQTLKQSDIALPDTTNVFLTGAGLAMMDGVVSYLSEALKKNVILPEIEAVNYSTPNYFNSIGLLDYILTNETG